MSPSPKASVKVSANLRRLIDVAAPYWAGEAEIFRTYWEWSGRSRETDRRWLALQCSKEIWGSGLAPLDKGIFLGPAEQLVAAFPRISTGRFLLGTFSTSGTGGISVSHTGFAITSS